MDAPKAPRRKGRPQSVKKSSHLRSTKQKQSVNEALERHPSQEMNEALKSLDGPARPVVTSDEEGDIRGEVRFHSSVPAEVADRQPSGSNITTRDDEDDDTASDQETGHNSDAENDDVRNNSNLNNGFSPASSPVNARNQLPVAVEQHDWDSDERSIASTVVPINRGRKSSGDRDFDSSDDYERGNGDHQQQLHRLAQQQRYVNDYASPRNIYDAALRHDYSNNYGEQSFVSAGDDEEEVSTFANNLGGLNLNDANEVDRFNERESLPTDDYSDTEIANLQTYIHNKDEEDAQDAEDDFSDDRVVIPSIEITSSTVDILGDEDNNDKTQTHADEIPKLGVEVPAESQPSQLVGADTSENNLVSADDKTNTSFTNLSPTTTEAPTPPVEEPSKHEWIDLFGTGELLKKTLVDGDSATSALPGGKNSNVRPQHRSLCLISYVGYVQLPDAGVLVNTENYDKDEINPEKAVVFTKLEQPKRIVVGEADDLPAIDIVLRMMRKNEKVRAIVKPRFGYGESGNTQLNVTAKSVLIFDVKLLDILSMEPPETTDEYRNKPDKLFELSRDKKEAGNRWYAMHMHISAVTAWQAGLSYADAALAALPAFLLNTSEAADVADKHVDTLRQQISLLKSLLYSNMSLAQITQFNYDGCLRSCEEALKLNPESIKCLVRKGKVLGLLGRHREATDTLRQAKKKVNSPDTAANEEEKRKWLKEIDDLMGHSSEKVKKETKQEQELFKRMLGGLSPKDDRKAKRNSAVKPAKQQLQKSRGGNDAAALVMPDDSSFKGGAFKKFFSDNRNVIVAGSFVAVTVGVIASAYFLKRK